MVKQKNASKSTNHRLTDFFALKSSQPSSQPLPSSSQASSVSRGKRPVRTLEDDDNLSRLISVFNTVDRKSVEKVYLECDWDLSKATAALRRTNALVSNTPRRPTNGAFEHFKVLSPSLTQERFDEAFRECGGNMKEISRMLLSEEYRQAIGKILKPRGLRSAASLSSSLRKSTEKTPKSPRGLERSTQPGSSQLSPHSNRDKGKTKLPPVSPLRPAKKENAPPPDVISISSEHSHITISSASAPSHMSIHSSEPTAPERGKSRKYLAIVDTAPRRSCRRSQRSSAEPVVKPESQLSLKVEARPRKKRKLPFESGLDEFVDLTNAGDVIYAVSKPTLNQPAVKVEPPSSKPASPTKSLKPASPKKTPVKCRTKEKIDSDIEEVEIIPSSQSDEEELVAPNSIRKDPKEVNDSVLRWQASSQTSGPFDEEADYAVSTEMDMKFTIGLGDETVIALEANETLKPPTSATPMSPTTIPSSPFTCIPPSTPRRTPPQSSSPTRCRVEPKLSTKRPSPFPIITNLEPSRDVSPKTFSSESSFTKVDVTPTSARSTSQRSIAKATPSSTPNKKFIVEVVVPRLSSTPHSVRHSRVASPVPTPPRALDQESKTADIIAQIKARAAAKSSPADDSDSEDDARRLSPLSDLSDTGSELDDGELDLFARIQKGNRASKPVKAADDSLNSLHSEAEKDATRLSPPELRRSVRHRIPSPSPSAAPTGTFAYSALHPPPGALPKTLTESLLASIPKKVRKPEGYDLKKLVKEKKANVKKAPAVFKDIDLPMCGEDDRNGEEGPSGSNLTVASDEDHSDVLDAADRQRLLGEDADERLERILADDLAKKGKENSKIEGAGGILFFDMLPGEDEEMQVDEAFDLPDIPEVCGKGVELLRRAIEAKDSFAISTILQSESLMLSNDSPPDGLLTWLVEAALSTEKTIAHSALRFISSIRNSQPISLTFIPKFLARLRPNQAILDSLGFDVLDYVGPYVSCDDNRQAVVWQLIKVSKTLGQRKLIEPEDVPSFVVLLLAIGLDLASSLDIQLDITDALETICTAYCSDCGDVRSPVERSICTRILRLAMTLNAPNKERLILLLPRNSPINKRIGQWIAFAMLSHDPESTVLKSSDFHPPLEHVASLINPHSADASTSSGHFKVRRDDFDYNALVHHTEVLARVLDNIPTYIALEKRKKLEQQQQQQQQSLVKNASFTSSLSSTSSDSQVDWPFATSPSKRPKAGESGLRLIENTLRVLSGKIVDSKAADPNRSRAKVTIDKLEIRLKYQREEAVDSTASGNGRPKKLNIEAYLTRR